MSLAGPSSGSTAEQRARFQAALVRSQWSELGVDNVHHLLGEVARDVQGLAGLDQPLRFSGKGPVKTAIYPKGRGNSALSGSLTLESARPKPPRRQEGKAVFGPRMLSQLGSAQFGWTSLLVSFTGFVASEVDAGPRIARALNLSENPLGKLVGGPYDALKQCHIALSEISPLLGLSFHDSFGTDSLSFFRRRPFTEKAWDLFVSSLVMEDEVVGGKKKRYQGHVSLQVPIYARPDVETSWLDGLFELQGKEFFDVTMPPLLLCGDDPTVLARRADLLFANRGAAAADHLQRATEVAEQFQEPGHIGLRAMGMLFGGEQGRIMVEEDSCQSVWQQPSGTRNATECRELFLGELNPDWRALFEEELGTDAAWEQFWLVAGCLEWRIAEAKRLFDEGFLLDATALAVSGIYRAFGAVIEDKSASASSPSPGVGKPLASNLRSALVAVAPTLVARNGNPDVDQVVGALKEIASTELGMELEAAPESLALPTLGRETAPTILVTPESDGVALRLVIPKRPRGQSRGDAKVREMLREGSPDQRLRNLVSSPAGPVLLPDADTREGKSLAEGSYGGEISLLWPLHAEDIRGADWLSGPGQLFLELMRGWAEPGHNPAIPAPDELEVEDVMFSFNQADAEAVDALEEVLSGLDSVKVWRYDVNHLKDGDSIREASLAAVRRSRVVVPVLSRAYWRATYCAEELWYAVSSEECLGLEVAPVMLDSTGSPDARGLLEWNLQQAKEYIPERVRDNAPSEDQVDAILGKNGLLSGEILWDTVISSPVPREEQLSRAAGAITGALSRSRGARA